MCGCGGGRNQARRTNTTRIRISGVRPNSAIANPKNFSATPNTTEEQDKRIQKLRRDAIRKTFGK